MVLKQGDLYSDNINLQELLDNMKCYSDFAVIYNLLEDITVLKEEISELHILCEDMSELIEDIYD